MKSLSKLVQRRPGIVIAVTLAITAVSVYGATKLTVNTGMRGFFPATDPDVVVLDRVDEAFGGSDYIMIAAAADEVFTPRGLRVMDDLTSEIENIDGVHSVRSISNMVEMRSSPWGLDVVKMVDEIPEDQAGADEVRRRMESNAQISGVLISDDGAYVLSLVQLEHTTDAGKVAGAVGAVIDDVGGGLTFHVAGAPVLSKASEEYLRDDLFHLFPIAAAVILTILVLSFRTVGGVVLPLGTVFMSIAWALGVMGFAGMPLTQMSAVLPVVLLSSGSAYGIHMMHRYYEERATGPIGPGAAARALESVGVPIILAGVTTVAGFGSNVFSSISRMRDFGTLTAFGVACALVIALTFVPSVLVLLDRKQSPKRSGGGSDREDSDSGTAGRRAAAETSSSALERFGEFVLRSPGLVAIVTIALIIWSVAGLARLKVDTNFANFFDANSVARRDVDLIGTEFGGVDTIQVMVEGDILDPRTLAAMEQTQAEFEKTEGFGVAFSVVDVVRQVSLALHDDDPGWDRIPTSREEAAQYLLLVSMSGDVGLDQMLSLDQTQARIQVMVDENVNSSTKGGTLDEARAIVARNLANVDTIDDVSITGLPFLGQAMDRQIVSSQIQSLFFAALSVAVIVYFSLGRSWRSVLCMGPIVLTILANFGLMGWTNTPVNLVTALVSSIAVGIGIDYSVHIYSRFTEGLRKGLDPEEAMHRTIAYTGKAVVLNAVSVAAGFAVMLMSKFPPVRQFGTLIAVTMAVSGVGSLTVLPVALLAACKRDTKVAASCR